MSLRGAEGEVRAPGRPPRRASLRAGGVQVLAHTLRHDAPATPQLREGVAAILERVRAEGDDALVAVNREFGSPAFTHDRLRTPKVALETAGYRVPAVLREAIATSASQVRQVAEALMPRPAYVRLPHGQRVSVRVIPVDSVGCYVPGGRAAYPSSLIMAAVPAQVAGVGRIAVVSPPGPDGKVAPAVLATAAALGLDEVYAAGGAAAIGALAYGTATIPPVAVVVGPGNPWVQEAKRQVVGVVGIESVAGPSEVLVLADDSADPRVVAADLLAQAEHGPDSLSVLATTDRALLDAVAEAVAREPASDGMITLVECGSWTLAAELAEALAPEHLQLNLRDAEAVAERVRSAGAVFVGPNGGTAFGDYVAGSNHVLPTGGAARFASALGPATYVRHMSVVEMPQGAVDALTPHLAALADAEGFPQHRRSAEIRTSR
jgi:histidinol dehydrogenase